MLIRWTELSCRGIVWLLLIATFGLRSSFGEEALPVTPPRPVPAQSPDDDALVRRLLAIWDGERSEIVSCDVRYRIFFNQLEGQKTPEQFDAICASADLTHDENAVGEFITALNGKPYRLQPPWGKGRLVMIGEKMRSETSAFTFVQQDDLFMQQDIANHQFNVFSTGQSSLGGETLSSFRHLPYFKTPESYAILGEKAGRIDVGSVWTAPGHKDPQLAYGLRVADSVTGVIVSVSSPDFENQPSREERYLDLTDYGEGIVFPRVAVFGDFDKGILNSMKLIVIDSAHWNEPVSDALFQLPAKEKNVVVDCRAGERPFYLPADTKDLGAFMRERDASMPSAGGPRAPAGRSWLLILNGAVCLGIGFYLWRSRSGQRRGMSRGGPDRPRSSHPS